MALAATPGRTLHPLRWLVAVCCVLLVGALGGLVALRHFRLPQPTGPYAVGTCILSLTDTSRHEEHETDPAARRSVVVQLWYPAAVSSAPHATYLRWREATLATAYEPLLRTNSRWNAPAAPAANPFPVLLFGHRWDGQRTQNTDLAEELASHGYVVAAVDHPYNSARVELGDGRIIRGVETLGGPAGATTPSAAQIAYWNRTLDVWAADDLFVLNELAAKNRRTQDPLYGKLDTDHVGAFGHSFGGAVSLRLCGLDPRIKAAVNLDGWTFGAMHDRTSAQPVLVMYEGSSVARRQQLATLPTPGSVEDQLDRADMAAVDGSLARWGGYRVYLSGTQHMDFSDQPLLPPLRRGKFTGPMAPLRVQEILREDILEFFNHTLRGKPEHWLQTQGQAADVTVESWPAAH